MGSMRTTSHQTETINEEIRLKYLAIERDDVLTHATI